MGVNMNKLTKIKLIKQPINTDFCGVACIKMILEYYHYEHDNFENIWNIISDSSPIGRIYCKTNKMGQYLKNIGLDVTIIKYSNLKLILEYCLRKSIPAIMNIYSFENNSMGHFVVFINYADNSVIIRDPENSNRITVTYKDLEKNLQS
jgi:ABC-type bacteriocin/lantibiotic exporter with double-glycine peptidase domain